MAYHVELTVRAARDLDYLYQQVHASESLTAARWYNGLEKAIYTLERFPRRCPLAPEARKAQRPVRHLLYGTKPHVYRVLYEIDEPGKAVRVLTIRHGAMDEFIAEG
jgi:plasmid stabilization system protein ParE